MGLLDAGRNIMVADVIGESITEFNNANANLCVGDGVAAFDKTHTDLQGASKFRKAVDATFPTRSINVLTFRATYALGEANFHWQEWGVANAGAGGTLLNRRVEDLGTKTGVQVWQLTATLTVGNP